jgi:prefoldin subunit 5
MAIKKQPTKLTEEEANQLRDIKYQYDAFVFQLGQVALAQIELDEQTEAIKTELKSLQKEEETLAKTLFEKYGKGEIDIKNNTITPV